MDECLKHIIKMEFVMVLLEKANIYNGILMETTGISVMVSNWASIVCFFSRVINIPKQLQASLTDYELK